MIRRIPIAGYMQIMHDQKFSATRVATTFHFPCLYSYIFFRSQGMIILTRFLGFKRRIYIKFKDIASIKKRRAFPIGFCIKVDLTLNLSYHIYMLSLSSCTQIIKILSRKEGAG